jgi:AraC-like DNA-binding protein
MVAGLGATLREQADVHGYREPPPPETFAAALGPPSLFVVETLEHRPDWLDRAAPIVERFCPARTIVLGDDTTAMETRFWFGEGCVFLRHPFPLTTLLEVVCNVLSDAPARRPWHDERTAKVIDAVTGGYADFRLRRLARTLGIAPYRLSGSFKHRMGVPLNTYLTRVRVYAARYLLEQHRLKVEAVARRVGFHDASHLSNAFRRMLGSRPGPHRRGRSAIPGPPIGQR